MAVGRQQIKSLGQLQLDTSPFPAGFQILDLLIKGRVVWDREELCPDADGTASFCSFLWSITAIPTVVSRGRGQTKHQPLRSESGILFPEMSADTLGA